MTTGKTEVITNLDAYERGQITLATERDRLEREVIEAAKEDLQSETRRDGDHGIDRLIAARRRYRAAVIALLAFEAEQKK